jgi:hypothetical protein
VHRELRLNDDACGQRPSTDSMRRIGFDVFVKGNFTVSGFLTCYLNLGIFAGKPHKSSKTRLSCYASSANPLIPFSALHILQVLPQVQGDTNRSHRPENRVRIHQAGTGSWREDRNGRVWIESIEGYRCQNAQLDLIVKSIFSIVSATFVTTFQAIDL